MFFSLKFKICILIFFYEKDVLKGEYFGWENIINVSNRNVKL